MGKTFAEKALARAAGLAEVIAGQVVDARPDWVLSHDNTAAIAKIFHSIGLERAAIPERLAITLDHAVPAPTARHAQNHAEVRAFVHEQGVEHFFEVGRGICHQIFRGDFFGEMAFIDASPRSADAVALEPTELLVLSRHCFDGMASRHR